jgi:hypothetical protein
VTDTSAPADLFNVWMFNITNIDEVRAGGLPKLVSCQHTRGHVVGGGRGLRAVWARAGLPAIIQPSGLAAMIQSGGSSSRNIKTAANFAFPEVSLCKLADACRAVGRIVCTLLFMEEC